MHFTKHRHTFLLTERNRGRHNRLLWNSRLRPSLTGRSGDWPEATTASGGSARAPRLHPLPRAACTLLFGRGIILVTPLAGLRARPFRKASRDPLSSRRAATGSFQSRNDPPQRSRAAGPPAPRSRRRRLSPDLSRPRAAAAAAASQPSGASRSEIQTPGRKETGPRRSRKVWSVPALRRPPQAWPESWRARRGAEGDWGSAPTPPGPRLADPPRHDCRFTRSP